VHAGGGSENTMNPRLPPGFSASAVEANIKKPGRLDLCLVATARPTPASAVWTKNRVQAAPIVVDREHLATTGGKVRAILANSGCANAATGSRGIEAARACARLVAEALSCEAEEVLVFSTGVIGAELPLSRIEAAIPALVDGLSPERFADANRAIMTTDTREKRVEDGFKMPDGRACVVSGMAKGSGMIHPSMATMLGFLFTDGLTSSDQGIFLRAAVDNTFNCVTVDGDTSTNDSVLLWSSARIPVPEGDAEASYLRTLERVSENLAREIARDGEGATKLVTVRVTGAGSRLDADRCAHVIATSPLVKTAVFGRDPNWGRILAAAGRSDVYFDPAKASVGIGEACLSDERGPHAEREEAARAHLGGDDVILWVDLGQGNGEARVFTCDFSPGYVQINADYRS
jgi:glutamate N-acetyltransferase/amino-acid N-acetyltransferase